ncbi:MAG: single-stranded DNA-binding protein [Betaproteobacteria bacterium]|nr:single-stranded DNA-binding protein [Betaproteobacteria bacterium]
MLSVLATGTLTADPRERTTSAGKAFATCLLRVPVEDGEPLLCSAIAFNADAVAALLGLAKGDSAAIVGRARLASWEKGGEQRHGLSVVADRVLTVYQAGKQRKAAAHEAEEALT